MFPRYYLYKLVAENGGAPCVEDGLLSLCICKPRIRTTAQIGDLIFGFAGKTLHADNRLVYIARVTRIVPGQAYFADGLYQARADCIYRFRADEYQVRPNPLYHGTPEQLRHDLGSPPSYPRARVLLSDDFRYFGGDCRLDLTEYPAILATLRTLTRGHRVNHSIIAEAGSPS